MEIKIYFGIKNLKKKSKGEKIKRRKLASSELPPKLCKNPKFGVEKKKGKKKEKKLKIAKSKKKRKEIC